MCLKLHEYVKNNGLGVESLPALHGIENNADDDVQVLASPPAASVTVQKASRRALFDAPAAAASGPAMFSAHGGADGLIGGAHSNPR